MLYKKVSVVVVKLVYKLQKKVPHTFIRNNAFI